MGQKIASLEIELGMATGTAVADLNRFGGTIDKVSAQAIRDLDRIDASMKNVGGLDAATASAVRLAEEAARTALQMARDADRSERAGERVATQLERQIAVYGLTREQVRTLRAEEAARAADQNGQSELATRIRAREAELYEMEFAAARKARLEAEAAAEAKELAAQQAIAAAEREAQAMRMAAQGPAIFEVAARRAWAAARDTQEAQAAATRESESLAASAQRLRASIDPAYAAQVRFDQEMSEARRLISAGAISLDDYAAKLREQQAALDIATAAQGRGTVNAAALRQATAGASYQVQDFVTQISMGANPITAFVVQGGQLAGQFMNVGGRAGAVATFLMGPWGLALQIGLMALGPLAAKLFETGETLEDLLKKKQEDADKSRMQARANEAWAGSLDGVIEKTRTLNGELMQQLRTRQQIDQAKLTEAQAQLGVNQDTFASTLKALVAARAELASAVAIRDTNPDARLRAGYSDSADRAQTRVIQLEREIAKLAGSVRVAESAVRAAEITIDQRTVKAGLTAAGQATEQYEVQLGALNERYRVGQITRERYIADLQTLEKAHQKATEAAKEQGRATHDAEIATSASIAKMMRVAMPGVQITSTTGGKHVAGSDHYKNAAVDFVPAGGMDSMTKAQVREMFSTWGIAIKRNAAGVEQLFGPGDRGHSDHFHVAWEKGRLALDGYTDAMRRSKVEADKAKVVQREQDQALADITKRFGPVQQAANDYAAAIGKINELETAGRITGATAFEYRQSALEAENKRRSDVWAASAKSIFDIKGDPLGEILDQAKDAQRQRVSDHFEGIREEVSFIADQWDLIASNVQNAASGMADAFGDVGRAVGDVASIYADYLAQQAREEGLHKRNVDAAKDAAAMDRENRRHAVVAGNQQIAMYGDMASAAKDFFHEGSVGYRAVAAAEKAFRVAQFAMSVAAMVQNAAETLGFVNNSAAKSAANATEGVSAQARLPFPMNLIAMAATGAALVAAGVAIVGSIGGSGSKPVATSEGRGTVLGDPDAQSESIRRGIDSLREVDVLMLNASRQMLNSLRSIDTQIDGFAAQIVRSGDVNASAGLTEGFRSNAVGSVLKVLVPVFGSALAGLFGSKTKIVGSGLYGGAQSVGDILAGGYDASTYSDVQKTKKFLGVTTSKKTSTQYAAADGDLENQIGLILRGFVAAIGAAAGPLGEATDTVQAKLNGFVFSLGKLDLQGLTGEQISDKLEAIFGAAADDMAASVFPGIGRFQRAGEGMFETLVRVSSTVEAVTASFEMLGRTGIGVDASVELAGLFGSVSDLTSAQQAYFEAFYDEAEQATAHRAQLERALGSLGVAMPATLASFRALVEAQDLATEAGRSTYATLIQLAPAFADLQAAMGGAKSAADIMAERQDLERKLLELNGDDAAIRALDLAKLDASNRGLQQQVWAAQAAQDAAKAAEEARKAWASVGDGLLDEVKRIRGLDTAQGPAGFAGLMGQFNAVTSAARAGDQEAAKQLPALSRSLLDAAAKAATSRQELDRVQAQAAASLEATYAAIAGYGAEDGVADTATRTAEAMAQASAAATTAASATSDLVSEVRQLREEVAGLRSENREGHAATATEAGRSGKVLERAAGAVGGDVIGTRAAA